MRNRFSHFTLNFTRSELPYSERIRLLIKNNAFKVKNGTDCCGNHGEPGC